MDCASRPRLIDRLRLFHLFRRHFGDEDAEPVVDALQDEFSPVATKDDLSQSLRLLKAEIEAMINGAMLRLIAAMGIVAGVALAIARFS